jgi:hypothetical protein
MSLIPIVPMVVGEGRYIWGSLTVIRKDKETRGCSCLLLPLKELVVTWLIAKNYCGER